VCVQNSGVTPDFTLVSKTVSLVWVCTYFISIQKSIAKFDDQMSRGIEPGLGDVSLLKFEMSHYCWWICR